MKPWLHSRPVLAPARLIRALVNKRGGMHHAADLGRGDAARGHQLAHAFHDRQGWIVVRGQHLEAMQLAARIVERDQIGKRSADINANGPFSQDSSPFVLEMPRLQCSAAQAARDAALRFFDQGFRRGDGKAEEAGMP